MPKQMPPYPIDAQQRGQEGVFYMFTHRGPAPRESFLGVFFFKDRTASLRRIAEDLGACFFMLLDRETKGG